MGKYSSPSECRRVVEYRQILAEVSLGHFKKRLAFQAKAREHFSTGDSERGGGRGAKRRKGGRMCWRNEKRKERRNVEKVGNTEICQLT